MDIYMVCQLLVFSFLTAHCVDLDEDIVASPVRLQNLVDLAKDAHIINSLNDQIVRAEDWLKSLELLVSLMTDTLSTLADSVEIGSPQDGLRYLYMLCGILPAAGKTAQSLSHSEFATDELVNFTGQLASVDHFTDTLKGSNQF